MQLELMQNHLQKRSDAEVVRGVNLVQINQVETDLLQIGRVQMPVEMVQNLLEETLDEETQRINQNFELGIADELVDPVKLAQVVKVEAVHALVAGNKLDNFITPHFKISYK